MWLAVLYGATWRQETRTNPNGSCSRLYITTFDGPWPYVAQVTLVFCAALPSELAGLFCCLTRSVIKGDVRGAAPFVCNPTPTERHVTSLTALPTAAPPCRRLDGTFRSSSFATALPVQQHGEFGRAGVRIPAEARDLVLAVGHSEPPIHRVPGFLPGREADRSHSLPSPCTTKCHYN